MKDIKDMTLTECIDRLRELPDGTCQDQFDMRDLPWIWDVAEELANRIDTLLFEQAQRHDAWVDALENRINSLEAERRWIPVSERMPTEADGDGNGEVLVSETENESPHRKYTYMKRWNKLNDPDYFHTITHWKRITPPEATP
jgi:hypothetical protein